MTITLEHGRTYRILVGNDFFTDTAIEKDLNTYLFEKVGHFNKDGTHTFGDKGMNVIEDVTPKGVWTEPKVYEESNSEPERKRSGLVEDTRPEVSAANALSEQVGGGHYKGFEIQPIEFIHKNKLGFIEGNIIKYICREESKGKKEDLLKVIHYARMLLELKYGVNSTFGEEACSE